ncbi:MAG: type II toxin-antitoxin system Phd/YefM family antitoxin [Burkholderiales bacterium]|nr:type II toxin-antitoxin system Phd/YefM family antitoxin [Burkholderiales bacterium]
MKFIGIRDAKAKFSALIEAAEHGQPTMITRHGLPACPRSTCEPRVRGALSVCRHAPSGVCIHAGMSRWPCNTRQTSIAAGLGRTAHSFAQSVEVGLVHRRHWSRLPNLVNRTFARSDLSSPDKIGVGPKGTISEGIQQRIPCHFGIQQRIPRRLEQKRIKRHSADGEPRRGGIDVVLANRGGVADVDEVSVEQYPLARDHGSPDPETGGEVTEQSRRHVEVP